MSKQTTGTNLTARRPTFAAGQLSASFRSIIVWEPSVQDRVSNLHEGRLAQLVRASRLHRECRGFESLTAHQSHFARLISKHQNPAKPLVLWGFLFSRASPLTTSRKRQRRALSSDGHSVGSALRAITRFKSPVGCLKFRRNAPTTCCDIPQ